MGHAIVSVAHNPLCDKKINCRDEFKKVTLREFTVRPNNRRLTQFAKPEQLFISLKPGRNRNNYSKNPQVRT